MAKHQPLDRRAWLEHYETHERNVAATARHFGISRSTLYRWIARYDPASPRKSLRPRSRRPGRVRTPSWKIEDVLLVAELTLKRPRWGRGRIWAALVANGRRYSPATVGRILGAVRARCPICKGRGGAHNEVDHLLRNDMEAAGFRWPVTVPKPRRPHPSRSSGARQAVRQAEQIIRNPFLRRST